MQSKKRWLLGVAAFVVMLAGGSAHAAGVPKILYTDIVAGPNTGGELNLGCYLSIFGTDFGNDINGVRVFVGDGEVSRYLYLGPSLGRPDVQQLSVQLGPAVGTGTIRVVVGSSESNNDHRFTVRQGDIHFVSLSGSNSTGKPNDIGSPYRTANYVMGLDAFGPGDFMVVRGGTYNLAAGAEGLYNNRWINLGLGDGRTEVVSGSSEDNAITIYGYPGERAIVDWGTLTGSAVSGVRSIYPLQYYSIGNLEFELRDSGGYAVYLGFYSTDTFLNNSRLINLQVRGGMAGAVEGLNTFSLQRVDYLKLYGLNIGRQSSLADPGLRSHMIYMSHFYNNADIGWCFIHDNRYGRAAIQVAGDPWGATPYAQGKTWGMNTNVRIHDNIFKNLAEAAILFGLGSYEIFVYNNLIENANSLKLAGFSPVAIRGAGLGLGKYYLYNNTIITDAESGGIIQMGYSPGAMYPETVDLIRNIIYAKSSSTNYYQINHNSFLPEKIASEENLWYGSSQAIPSWAGSIRVLQNPLFSSAELGDYTLSPNSPALARGIVTSNKLPVRRDFNGNPRPSAVSLGAYEGIASTVISEPVLRIK